VRRVLTFLGWILILGLAVAVLAAFDYDPFAVLAWILKSLWGIISQIGHFIGSWGWFKDLTSAPFPDKPIGHAHPSPSPK